MIGDLKNGLYIFYFESDLAVYVALSNNFFLA